MSAMEHEYIALKTFSPAGSDDIFEKDAVLSMTEEDAASLIEQKKIKPHLEEKSPEMAFDMKAFSDALEKGAESAFSKFAPKPTQTTKKIGYGEYLQSIAAGPESMADLKKKGINIGTDGQGGYATTEFTDPEIDVDLIRESGLAEQLRVTTLSGTNNTYKFNVVNSMGTAPAITVEGATIPASQPVVQQFSISLLKCTYRFDATEEAIEDTGALISEINAQVPEEFSKFIESGVINGNTAFTAVIGDTNTVTIAAESGQTTATIIVENVDKMFCSAKNPNRSMWVMSRSAYCAVQNLEDSAGNRIFMGPNGMAAAPFGTLKGLPIMISDFCQALGTLGDILLMDPKKYRMASKGGLKMASSAHVKFLTDETVFKFTYRLGGLPAGLKLTATDGTEIGDVVELASRGSS